MQSVLSWPQFSLHLPRRACRQLTAREGSVIKRSVTKYAIAKMSDTLGKPIECKAAIAWEAKKPLEVRMVTVAPPGPGEVRLNSAVF